MSWAFAPLKPFRYELILADPPTHYRGYSPFDDMPYPVMVDEWLLGLPVKQLAAADCLLCLWSTMPKLDFSMALLKRWGFRYVTGGAWFKRTRNGKIAYGRGQVLQTGAEVFLLGALGRPRYHQRPVKGVFENDADFDQQLGADWGELQSEAINALRREHSRKPDEVYGRLETLMGDVPRVELFAQQRWPGWHQWGDDVDRYPAAVPEEQREAQP